MGVLLQLLLAVAVDAADDAQHQGADHQEDNANCNESDATRVVHLTCTRERGSIKRGSKVELKTLDFRGIGGRVTEQGIYLPQIKFLIFLVLTQALRITKFGYIPKTIRKTLSPLVTQQNEALVTLKGHLGTRHKIKAQFATKSGRLQDTTGNHTPAEE